MSDILSSINNTLLKGVQSTSRLMEINFRLMEELSRNNGQVAGKVFKANAESMASAAEADSLKEVVSATSNSREAVMSSLSGWREDTTHAFTTYRHALSGLYGGGGMSPEGAQTQSA